MAKIYFLGALIVLQLVHGSNAQASAAATTAFSYAVALTDPTDSSTKVIDTSSQYAANDKGAAVLRILPNEKDVQKSNFEYRSCKLTNVGEKRIAAVYIDVSTALIPDVVYDADGSGGDSVSKPLNHDWGTTEALPVPINQYQWQWQPVRGSNYNGKAPFNPNALSNFDNLFVDELSNSGKGASGGNKGILILFKDYGKGEVYDFSADMDSNSIAGLDQGSVFMDAGWDVGGVSGAEMIGSKVTLLFGDGTTATGTLAADGSQAGSVANIRSSGTTTSPPAVTIGGTEKDGNKETYTCTPTVTVAAMSGQTVRVTMMRGFDPTVSREELANGQIKIKDLVAARLNAQFPYFPVNNAREFQHVVVTMGKDTTTMDITSSFRFNGKDALAFTAVVIDKQGADGLPISDVSKPVYLIHAGEECKTKSKCDISIPLLGPIICLLLDLLANLFG